ncbi:hypothetical protein [Halobaculum magnesiiphilum]|uniref:Uncharacterized protein n=1 Tax=Halobaculum magnesiiphilum TaxID=1017351 RepID=A0A8T8WG03_9EURY|nr:hypothetical protein [Halobaculum magnesiiphilum]QZP38787.1 hypothetical protein K6T50_06525 [Halobaculum magnesiiphilum]
MIVVVTDDFALYHAAVAELRERGATFTTREPGGDLPERAAVVISAPHDDLGLRDDSIEHVTTTPDRVRDGVEEALGGLRETDGRTVVGVDPGEQPGIAVLSGDTVVAAYHVPLGEAVDTVLAAVDEEPDALVRVGDGDRLRSARVVNGLEDVSVELVDESGTTPTLGRGAGGKGMADVLAAVNIARMEGDPVETRAVEPTAGEIQRIKNESRDRSSGDLTVSEELAREVALGELTLAEAIAEQRDG